LVVIITQYKLHTSVKKANMVLNLSEVDVTGANGKKNLGTRETTNCSNTEDIINYA
jgi:hypothetical protein